MIRVIPWSAPMAQKLSRALGSTHIVELIGEEVRQGISQLWECSSEKHHAYCVTRLDRNPIEWCIVAFEGSGLMEFGPQFIAAARSRGVPLRAHVADKRVERMVRWLGMRPTETVLRVA